jgi:hypothetical protein
MLRFELRQSRSYCVERRKRKRRKEEQRKRQLSVKKALM